MYDLKVTEEQARLIQKSLDLYSRILIGQFEEISNVILWDVLEWSDFEGNQVPCEKIHQFKDRIGLLKQELLGIPPNASHGIHSEKVSDNARKAYDIQKVIRHRIAWDNLKEGQTPFGVNFDEPDISSNDENYKLPTMDKK